MTLSLMNGQGLQQRLFKNHNLLEVLRSCFWEVNPSWRPQLGRIILNYSWEEGQKLPILCKRENSNHKIFHLGHCRFLDTLGDLLLVSSLQIQDRHQMLKAAFEFCLCNSELSSAFSSSLNSNTTSDVLIVSPLPAFLVKQVFPQGLLMSCGWEKHTYTWNLQNTKIQHPY